MRRRASAGFTVSESLVALSVVCVLAAVALVAGSRQIQGTADAFAESAALRVVSGVLDVAAAAPGSLTPGTRTVATEPVDALEVVTVTQTVTPREGGVVEVAAEVVWRSPSGHAREARLVTLVATGEVPR